MKILIVVAHCDDEVIMGWPVLQNNKEHEISILCCSSDRYNEQRKKWARRSEAFYSLCEALKIKCHCLDYNSGFYKTNSRTGELSNVIKDIGSNIQAFDFDMIYTHNMWGEYGHLDHQLVHNIVCCNFRHVMVSDIFIKTNWTPYEEICGCVQRDNCAQVHINDVEQYNYHKSFYDKIRCWTWNQEPVKVCKTKILKLM